MRHVPSGQNRADWLSHLTALFGDGVTEEYVRMAAVNAKPRTMTTGEIERACAEDEELTEVCHCWKAGDWFVASMKLPWLED